MDTKSQWFKPPGSRRRLRPMTPSIALLLALYTHPHPALKPAIEYTLRVDSADLSGWSVTLRLRTASDTFRLAMAAHPEYDDRYWRYVRDVAVDAWGGSVTRVDSAVWQVVAPRGLGNFVTVRYRIALPHPDSGLRAAWRPYLTASGGLIAGPHAFMYVLGSEDSSVIVSLDLPSMRKTATGLGRTNAPHTFTA